ncbi:hypothetical protein PHJA_001931500, partial [Phtheirospermum japonicum]
FRNLCAVLRDKGGLVVTKNVTLEEIASPFLHILAYDKKNSTITAIFVRSGGNISRQFHNVLRAVLKIRKLYIKQEISELSQESEERWRWFPNAVGALDGTLVKLTVLAEDRSRYKNRKGDISSNVLGVCDANLKFLYVLPSWEGLLQMHEFYVMLYKDLIAQKYIRVGQSFWLNKLFLTNLLSNSILL